MKTLTVHITVPDDRYTELRDLLKKFNPKDRPCDDLVSLSQGAEEFGIPDSTIEYWMHVKKILPFSQPVPKGKKFFRRSDLRKLIEIRDEKKKAPRVVKSLLNPRGER